ncbi:MAG: hypothetical protein ACE5JR_09835 [Gemmatimonadota bacterium]
MSSDRRHPCARRPTYRGLCGLLTVAVVAWACGCTDVPTATDASPPGPELAKKGKKPPPSVPQATFDLPAETGSAGLFSFDDGGGPFVDAFDPDQMALIVDCPRRFVLVRPATAWPVVSGDEVHCSSKGGGFSRLDLNDLGSRPCSDPLGCPIGTTGHTSDSGPGFSKDMNYYFTVRVPKPKGKGTTTGASYNVVWIDTKFTIDQADSNGTACRWHVWANTAEFWERTGDIDSTRRVDGDQTMALDVIVERQDLNCPV